ncbi:DUF2905 domain-containing protein [Alkalicoccus chagannorensis]|uniref:DUF2905 domain-containing protein n=1 Tax=Alkalicoccus chagannorensis TaxID=427072 RepID=UPI00040CD589|nr:DUF2905 domain-containing protein [Alkalicoccus chagannorensis]
MEIGRLLIVTGLVIAAAGLLWQFGGRFLPLGRLPGDIVIERGGTTIYLPLMTCIVLSALLSLAFMIFRR